MIKKVLVAAALCLVAVPALPQTWVKITDSADGLRLVVDSSTIKVDTYSKRGAVAHRVSATMQYTGTRILPPFIAIIDADDCTERGGGVLVNVLNNQESTTYVWDKDGRKMYDAQGQFLCGWLLRKIELYEKEKQQNQNESSNKPSA